MTSLVLALVLTAEPPLVTAEGTPQLRPNRIKFTGTVPEGYHLVETGNWGLIGSGLGVFAGGYSLWATIGTMLGSPENLIPIVGPALAYRPATGVLAGLGEVISVVAIAADVLTQLSGVVMIIIGLATPRRWLEKDDTEPAISFVPMAGGAAGAGASVVGRF